MSFLGVKRPDWPKKQSVTWDSQSISAKTTTPVTCDGRINWNGTVIEFEAIGGLFKDWYQRFMYKKTDQVMSHKD